MWTHFTNLLSRSWDAVIHATGTTTLGVVVWTILIAAVGWVATIVAKWIALRRSKTSSPFLGAIRDSVWGGVLTAAGIGLVVIVVFCVFLVRTTYSVHAESQHGGERGGAEAENAHLSERAMAFGMYRHARHGEPCVLWLSVPPTATSTLSSEVAQFSNSVSDCFTFSPFPGGGNPEYDEEAVKGMVPDTVIFHAKKGDKAALQLFDSLGSLFKMKLSYDLPPNIRSHYSLPAQIAGKERIVWLQFGTEVKWNSERR